MADIARPAFVVVGSRDLESLLTEMRSQGGHFAVVVDEYGGTAGTLTLEDIVEQIVGEIDDVIGFVHAKDLLRVEVDRRDVPLPPELVRDMLVVPETRELTDLLADMRRQRRHFALVVDEYGGTAGITTIEDVLEELVGEIRDEYDAAESAVVRLGPSRFLAPGSLRADELVESTGFAIPRATITRSPASSSAASGEWPGRARGWSTTVGPSPSRWPGATVSSRSS